MALFDAGELLVVLPVERTPDPNEVIHCDGRVWAPHVGLLGYHVRVPRPYLHIVRQDTFPVGEFRYMGAETEVYW